MRRREILAAFTLLLALPAPAAPERLRVDAVDLVPGEGEAEEKVARLVVTRGDGRTFVLEADPACGMVTPGDELLLDSEGTAPAPGARVRRPESGESCLVQRVEIVRVVRVRTSEETGRIRGRVPPADLRRALREALEALGYAPRPTAEGLIDALARYRADRWHDVRGKPVSFSFWALGLEYLVERAGDPEAVPTAGILFDAGD